MKTRSHKTPQKKDKHQKHGQSLSEEKELKEIGQPHKRQKIQSNLPLTTEQNEYDLIPLIPTVQLTVTDMLENPLPLITKLQAKHSSFGAVQLLCPEEWSPPLEFRHPKSAITTRIQPLNQLKLGKAFEEKKDAYTLASFHEFANDFERRYRMKFSEFGLTKTSQLENQYWKLVQGVDKETEALSPKKYKVTVEYAADLPADKYGSGFPINSSNRTKDLHFNYAENLYNLNNIFKAEGSMLCISEQKGEFIGGITTPWVYVGMMFSSFCWHVEDSGINSLNYNHFGSKKVWYIIPEEHKDKFDEFIEERFGNKEVVNKITYMIDPLELIKKGIKVYKAYQQPKQFICTFFNAYHCGFSQGFNVGEAVNFVIPQSLSYIKLSMQKSTKPSLFCYEWLIYQNYHTASKKGNVNSILKQEYHQILQIQERSLLKLLERIHLKDVNLVQEKIKYTRHLCAKCKKYLYLSFTCCSHCRKDYCLFDTVKCCQRTDFILMLRNPNKERQKYVGKLLK